ncbi:MAG: AAA family ATPase, partial [Gammaproteobacteria bacterium]
MHAHLQHVAQGQFARRTVIAPVPFAVTEHVGIGSKHQGLIAGPICPSQDVPRWLDRVGLADYIDRKVEELSKGMAQKLQFITTIIHKPDIVILDELFSGLDPVNIELIKDILLDLKRENRTILFSTHVMEQA